MMNLFLRKEKLKIYRIINKKLLPSSICKILLNFSLKLFTLFKNNKTKYITYFSSIYGHEKETHKMQTIFPLKLLVFENKFYFTPNDYDNFSSTIYGDYMLLPPIEKRKAHTRHIVFNTLGNNNNFRD